MKHAWVLAIVLANSQTVLAFSGNQLIEQLKLHQQITDGRIKAGESTSVEAAFALGFVSGIFFVLNDIDSRVCLPAGGINTQYMSVTQRFLENNPNQLHRPAQSLVREAAIQAFPCKR